jgi:2'-5' RNA ligase
VPRLFSAVVPPEPALDHLSEWLSPRMSALGADLRWNPRSRWHITLGFYGDGDDPDRRTVWLRTRLAGLAAPRLRLAGGGTFPGVLWAGVDTDADTDAEVFAAVADAAGAGDDDRLPFRPHLTLARWRRDRAETDSPVTALNGYTGPWFTPDGVVLMRSETARSGFDYTAVERIALAGD